MTFEKDLFISYAHIDDQPIPPEQHGWVSRFHTSLAVLLSMHLGQKARIWRDIQLDGNDQFSNEIIDQFAKTALLLSIVSPSYLKSKWCAREVQEFCEVAERSLGLTVGNKSRVVKIIKSPIDKDGELPPAMGSSLGYQFYFIDQSDTPFELDSALYGPDMAQKYNLMVAKLAWEIKQILNLLEKSGMASGSTGESAALQTPPPKPTVYLAECSYDLRDAREALDTELRRHGYRVLPDRQLPRDETAYRERVAEYLGESQLSIHLVGSRYGAVPDGPSQKSVVMLQNELAIERSRKSGLKRIIWIPEGVAPAQEEQARFIQYLQTDPEGQYSADVVTSAQPETIKNTIHATLQKLQEPKPAVSARDEEDGCDLRDNCKLIYLLCDERDRPETRPLRRFLRQEGFEVELPLFEGDAAKVRQTNQDLMTQSPGVLIYYGQGEEAWKRSVDRELRKFPRSAQERCVYTYLGGPSTEAKLDLVELEEPNLINGLNGFSEDTVLPFLNKVNSIVEQGRKK